MNIIIRLITVSLMISMLAFGFAGYAGSKTRCLPVSQTFEDVQTSCAVMLQDIKTLSGFMLAPALAESYYSGLEFPLPLAYEGIYSYPF